MNATPAEASQERTGGCYCGWIRFIAQGEPVYPHLCSCTHCQKFSGAPVMWWVGFATVIWTGEGGEPLWIWTFPDEARRGCCPKCGTRVAAIDHDVPEIGINVPALDDTTGADLVPVAQSFKDNAVPWLNTVPNTEPTPVG
ncbi:GFA family protein (plasmid) [Streptomyces sp. R39]|uniref:GFA family protein n=1 Tax=Streptomyces sp. R39 TaxID=3238631 RepID=A0AB39R4Y6_9ACTN